MRTLIDLMDDYSYIGQDAAPELIRIKEEIIRVANPTPIDPTPVDPPPPREPESEIKPA
ncbi:MAG TPA: hypothetical protein VMZ26_17495 [Pyrinomonadaceae bacterium]|nr:hypothetical protein [Pyrinomonadaceae bacterium]